MQKNAYKWPLIIFLIINKIFKAICIKPTKYNFFLILLAIWGKKQRNIHTYAVPVEVWIVRMVIYNLKEIFQNICKLWPSNSIFKNLYLEINHRNAQRIRHNAVSVTFFIMVWKIKNRMIASNYYLLNSQLLNVLCIKYYTEFHIYCLIYSSFYRLQVGFRDFKHLG